MGESGKKVVRKSDMGVLLCHSVNTVCVGMGYNVDEISMSDLLCQWSAQDIFRPI